MTSQEKERYELINSLRFGGRDFSEAAVNEVYDLGVKHGREEILAEIKLSFELVAELEGLDKAIEKFTNPETFSAD